MITMIVFLSLRANKRAPSLLLFKGGSDVCAFIPQHESAIGISVNLLHFFIYQLFI